MGIRGLRVKNGYPAGGSRSEHQEGSSGHLGGEVVISDLSLQQKHHTSQT